MHYTETEVTTNRSVFFVDLNEFLYGNEEGGVGIFGFAVLAIF